MAKITINIELDSSESLQEALQNSGLLTTYRISVEETTAPVEKPKRNKAKQPASEVPTQQAAEAPTQPAPEPTPLDEEAPKSESGVTLAALRETLSSKVGSHRSELKEKLNSLEASTVSTLAAEHYDEFMTFMQDLK